MELEANKGSYVGASMPLAFLTFIPSWLPQDLITSSIVLCDIVCVSVLLDCAIVVLGIATEAIQCRHLHGRLNSFDINLYKNCESL